MAENQQEELFLKNSELIWKVNMKNKNGEKNELVSPCFYTYRNDDSTTVIKWQLYFYPNGINSSENWVSLYIVNVDEVDVKQGSFTLSFYQSTQSAVTKSFNMVSGSWLFGHCEFAEKSFVLDPKNQFLIDDIMTISCIIDPKGSIILKNQVVEKSFSKVEFENFEKLFNNRDFSDVTLTADENKIYAHKCILACRSSIFDLMFKSGSTENQTVLNIDDVKPEVLHELIRFMYTGKVVEIEKIVSELLCAAEKYMVEGLKKCVKM